jgi:hypothetical protein
MKFEIFVLSDFVMFILLFNDMHAINIFYFILNLIYIHIVSIKRFYIIN